MACQVDNATMAETNDSTPTSGGSGGSLDRLMAFATEPLGMGLIAGLLIALGLGYYIL